MIKSNRAVVPAITTSANPTTGHAGLSSLSGGQAPGSQRKQSIPAHYGRESGHIMEMHLHHTEADVIESAARERQGDKLFVLLFGREGGCLREHIFNQGIAHHLPHPIRAD